MKTSKILLSFFAASLPAFYACNETSGQDQNSHLLANIEEPFSATSPGLARMLAALPAGDEQVREVHDAALHASSKGYDEEYTFRELMSAPRTKSGVRMADLIRDYIREKYSSSATKTDCADGYISRIADCDLQIYWPYSEDWDGEQVPYVTYDPGYRLETNYAFRLGDPSDSVEVDENFAMEHPVWVVNTNNDSGFTPVFVPDGPGAAPSSYGRRLILKSITMLRNYDSWFSGASEFWIKCGAVDGFSASTESELKLYSASVTDCIVVIKRRYLREEVPLDVILLTNFTNQMENLAFLVNEDDGGTVTSWRCSATVKIKSKSYGFDLDIPYRSKDDIVWRGQLASAYLQSEDEVEGRFGDVKLKFALE